MLWLCLDCGCCLWLDCLSEEVPLILGLRCLLPVAYELWSEAHRLMHGLLTGTALKICREGQELEST
jgi:hypothetical protein